MSPRWGLALLAAVAALALGGFLLLRPEPGEREDGAPSGLAARVRVETPEAGRRIESPLIVRGAAPGPWFFEANFPVRLLDGRGEVVADTFAEALGEWMTEAQVPFRAGLVFEPPATAEGTLVLERANPSGLPEHAAEVRLRVRFPASLAVRFFFPDSGEIATGRDCRTLGFVERRIPAGRDTVRRVLETLLAGPTSAERAAGRLTAIPPDAGLRSVTLAEGVARADFDAGLERGVAGSCRVLAIRAQIEETLRALPGVRRVVISVEGREEAVLQP